MGRLRGRSGIKIGAQLMPWHTGQALNLEHPARGHAPPLRNRLGRDGAPKEPAEAGITARRLFRANQSIAHAQLKALLSRCCKHLFQ